MNQGRWLASVLAVSTLGMLSLSTLAANRYTSPFPPIAVSLSSPVARLSDFMGIAMGFRSLTADLAWVQTLLYYGTDEEETPHEVAEQGGGKYADFLNYCRRAAEIDPTFKYIYYYGGGVLGWNLNRLDEAESLLREGIAANPKEWRFQQFLAGLAFQKSHNVNKLAEFLDAFVEQPDCPNILRSILANIYKKQGRYAESIQLWTMVYNTQDPAYLTRALSQIKEMAPLAHQKAQKMGQSAH